MSALLPPPAIGRVVAVVQRKEADLRAAMRDANVTVRSARQRARDARKQLAHEILAAYGEAYNTLDDFTVDVADRLGLSPRTVLNALRETFSADVLSECVSVLAEARTNAGQRA